MKKLDNTEIAVQFGAFIKAGRMKKNLTQQEAAKSLGLSQPYYHRIENGLRTVDLSLSMDICRLYDLDLNDFTKRYNP